MKFHFDAGQEHQLRAVQSVIDLFKGQHKLPPAMQLFRGVGSLTETIAAFPNRLDLAEAQILANLQAVQRQSQEWRNDDANAFAPPIPIDKELEMIAHQFKPDSNSGLLAGGGASFCNFSVEMETGTGKTYIYLRTIRELSEKYGFRKFIIVTPSVAVREGVLKAMQITRAHFSDLYPANPCEGFRYDSGKLNNVRDFANSPDLKIMVMTMAAFNKDANVIRRDSDSLGGDTPLSLVQATVPILILDEPQNMESDLSVESLARLNPLCTLRYSATHRNPYNLIYRLSPADAFNKNLVKRIEVDGLTTDDINAPYIRLVRIKSQRGGWHSAVIAMHVRVAGVIKKKNITVKRRANLQKKSDLPQYANFVVDDIESEPPRITFSNGIILGAGQEHGGDKTALFRAQIRATIEEHFRVQQKLKKYGIKVLSLFFIDKVANYQSDGGIIRRLFDECFDELKQGDSEWRNISAAHARAGYFASSKGGNTEKDVRAYNLIMRDKESLLSFASDGDDDETRRKRQVAFIFSHSALREGWDNPNIFQICTLNESISLMKKRQEIGRGVRLAVNQKGERVFDKEINTLTVVANESYADYARGYQQEIADEFGSVYAQNAPTLTEKSKDCAKANPRHIRRKRGNDFEFSPEFRRLWERISQRTRYRVEFNSDELISSVIAELKNATISRPAIRRTLGGFEVNEKGEFTAKPITEPNDSVADLPSIQPLPDIVRTVSDLLTSGAPPLMITKKTLFSIFEECCENALINPMEWANIAADVIRKKLADMMIGGIVYEKVDGKFHEWEQRFASEEKDLIGRYIAEMPHGNENAAYDKIDGDSNVEKEFAEDLSRRKDVKLFVKLPSWFQVPTPVGNYNPDWAILLNSGKLIFVAETKSAVVNGRIQFDELRRTEAYKIKYASRNFGSTQDQIKCSRGALSGVDYKVVHKADEITSS